MEENKYPMTYLDKVPSDKITDAVEEVWSVGDGEITISAKYDLDHAEINEMMLDNGYEKCKGCRNYVEMYELTDEDFEYKNCDGCQ